MKTPAFQRGMARLALAAMLLLALLPTSGRLLAGQPDTDGIWVQLCTRAGLVWVNLAADAAPATDLGAATGSLSGVGDCPYCPVLGGIALPRTLLPAFFPTSDRLAWTRWHQPDRPRDPHPSGLGSRGPPLLPG
ncbi:MAG: DUF2946 family protein [Lysobacteraceae bacterium]